MTAAIRTCVAAIGRTETDAARFMRAYQQERVGCACVIGLRDQWAFALCKDETGHHRVTLARDIGTKKNPSVSVYENIGILERQTYNRLVSDLVRDQVKLRRQIRNARCAQVFDVILQIISNTYASDTSTP